MQLEYARVTNHQVITDAYRVLVLEAPAIAPRVKPGQFVHLRIPNLDGSVLRRPFSVYRAEGAALSVLYKMVGKGTAAMAALEPGHEVSLMGPLGNGFPTRKSTAFPVLVAGGYGMAALYLLAKHLPRKGIVFVGGATGKDILCAADFDAAEWPVRIATEDGSLGTRGWVTDILDPWLKQERGARKPEFFACGPNGMLKAVGERAIAGDWKAWLSMDRHMGCGVGACLACVQKIKAKDGRAAWARVCKDGPVFESRQLVWE